MKIASILCRHLLILCCLLAASTCRARAAATAPALILRDAQLPAADARLAELLAQQLKKAGYQPRFQNVDELVQRAVTPQNCALLVLPQARRLPQVLAPLLNRYLDAGGHLLVLGAPLMQTALVRDDNGRWIPVAQRNRARAFDPPAHSIVDFQSDADIAAWERSSLRPTPARRALETVRENGREIGALHVSIDDLDGWDTLLSPPVAAPFSLERTITTFAAKGGPRTSALAVEWREKDNLRWIATVPLTQDWQRYELKPQDFRSWQNDAARAAKGFNLAHAEHLAIGLAFTHSGVSGGAHQFWIAQIGSETSAVLDSSETLKPRDALAPAYKFFPIQTAARLQNSAPFSHAKFAQTFAPQTLLSPQPRPDGSGFNRARDWRQIALLSASDANNSQWRGTPATLMVRAPQGQKPGALWATFTPDDAAFYRQPQVLALLEKTARRMRDGVFLLDGGTQFTTYFSGQQVLAGARIIAANAAHDAAAPTILRLSIAEAKGKTLWRKQFAANAKTGAVETLSAPWQAPANWPAAGFQVRAELLRGGQIIDVVQQRIYQWQPPAQPNWVTISDGHFGLNGQRWRIHGVNYMPSSGIGTEDSDYFEHWLSQQAYDATIIERDLSHIEALGFNAISVFIYEHSVDGQNLLDLLRRCRLHHLRVNLSLRPTFRNYFEPTGDTAAAIEASKATIRRIINSARTAEDDTVFAYDIDWEPTFGDPEQRRKFDPLWRRWVNQKYGDVGAAERAWQLGAPLREGELTMPTSAQTTAAGGAATKLMADYRHFLDDWLATTYGALTQEIHQLAPHQWVSFRAAGASNPVFDSDNLTYQFEGLARGLDFLSPEIYGQIGSENGEQAIGFQIAYARAVAPDKPLLYAEVGFNAANAASQNADAAGLQTQANYYATMLRIAQKFGADGIFWWWYPGGFRANENSDFGLTNPDGSDRPVTQIVRRDGARFLSAPFPPAPNAVFSFNRDAHPDGVFGIYRDLKTPFYAAVAAGKTPGLRAVP